MEITDLKKYFQIPLRGAIHIGAHHAQEKKWYDQNGIKPVIWIEANPDYYEIIKNNVGDDLIIINGVGNENKTEIFNIANNGQSSSFLELGTHKEKHPDVFYTNTIKVEIKKMTDIINENKIEIDNYNFLNIDVQGFELEVIKGFDDYISKFDYIYSEVNVNYLYKNCPLINEIDEYLSKFNFKRIETKITDWGWGDAIYIKQN